MSVVQCSEYDKSDAYISARHHSNHEDASLHEKGDPAVRHWPAVVVDVIGQKKKYKKINIGNLKANISNKKVKQSVGGNTNAVYINPLNSLRFVLNKVKKDKVDLGKDFYVFTGSTVGIVPILGKGVYTGKIDKLGSVKAIIS